ncbi:MAG: hypothetical protein JWP23_3448 [Phenylobacterium sp.]|jgi:hypothetical protein|nr:hypothetical protein [Phenylobacterium sp.]
MLRSFLAVLIAGAALNAVCGSQTFASPAPLTAEGWGGIKIGMPEAAAMRRFGLKESNRPSGNESCHEDVVPGYPQLIVMIDEGRIARFSLYERGPLQTDRGFGIGARENDIRKAYGPTLKVEPHAYDDQPAHYLTFWTKPGRKGVRYETDTKGRVNAVHVGGAAIQYIEGCD